MWLRCMRFSSVSVLDMGANSTWPFRMPLPASPLRRRRTRRKKAPARIHSTSCRKATADFLQITPVTTLIGSACRERHQLGSRFINQSCCRCSLRSLLTKTANLRPAFRVVSLRPNAPYVSAQVPLGFCRAAAAACSGTAVYHAPCAE